MNFLVPAFQEPRPRSLAPASSSSSAEIRMRISRTTRSRGTPRKAQEGDIRAYCGSHDLELGRVFREQGESAKTADRTQLQTRCGAPSLFVLLAGGCA